MIMFDSLKVLRKEKKYIKQNGFLMFGLYLI